jgi:hypothetical protein
LGRAGDGEGVDRNGNGAIGGVAGEELTDMEFDGFVGIGRPFQSIHQPTKWDIEEGTGMD